MSKTVGGIATHAPLTHPSPSQSASPAPLHRAITLLAVISLFIGTRGEWSTAIASRPKVGGVIMLGYAGILILGVLALAVRNRRALVLVDAGVLLLGIVLALCSYALGSGMNDETVLMTQATHELVHGHAVYGHEWPWVFQQHHVGVTKTMSGGADYSFAYPPLAVLLNAPVYALIGAKAATLVPTLLLIVGAAVLWWLLPTPWRSAATAVCLGFPMLKGYAAMGYPAIPALVLLIPVVIRWPSIGAGGRLRRSDIVRAALLGAACATHQLPWFLTPFLLVGVYAVRRGELSARAALGVVTRFTAISAVVALTANAYFIAQSPRAWITGLALPFTQHGVLHGQGIMGLSYYFTDGSSRLDFYSYGSMLLAAGLLTLFVLFVRRLGPAATVLPWCAFYLATRSQDGYYLLMTPLWVAAAATATSSDFASAWQPRLPFGRRRVVSAMVAAAVLAPAAACVAVAAASGPPIRLVISGVRGDSGGVHGLTVQATNTGDTALAPHFASSTGESTSAYWTVRSGPAVLGPHQSARYELVPSSGRYSLPNRAHLRVRLRVFTDRPQTLSSTDIHVPKR
ncbi:membrane protein [Streptomyces xylophagus]|uniref:membrane protein n=1 Tax=Streptomyces xylophagus TaxID=285514 RepID=UPI0005BA551C|nr:membrane protein [Streptomyces xylophagus]